MLDGKRIDQYFPPRFFKTEFWYLWSTIMGSWSKHSAIEFRRYMNRFLYLFGHLSDMTGVMRTPLNQHETFIQPLVKWLRPRNVNFMTGAFVRDLSLAPAPGRITVDRLDYERDGAMTSVPIAAEDIVLVTTGSQAADKSAGSMTEPPKPRTGNQSWALWQRLSEGRTEFGHPDVFFGAPRVADSRWVTFTVTDTGTAFVDKMTALTGSTPGLGGLVTLKDSNWVISLSIFHQPEIVNQPSGTSVWWGYGLYPECPGNYAAKPMNECTGKEILDETLRHLPFDQALRDTIMATSTCVPCDMPYVNNIWLPRRSGDRPPPVPKGSTNLGLIGQYVEVPKEIAFTIECSTRTAWVAIHTLLKRGPPPPPVYQSQYHPKALFDALKVFICPWRPANDAAQASATSSATPRSSEIL